MKKNDLIQAARIIANQCSQRNTPSTWTYEYAISRIESLMTNVAESKREECARVCDEAKKHIGDASIIGMEAHHAAHNVCENLARKIRKTK